jgi:transcriptional regulator of acetoin/glycerol metabolism
LGLNSEEAPSSPKDDGLDEVNEPTLLALFDDPFSSVQQIARKICVPKSTLYRRLVDALHFTFRHQASSFGSSQAL